jgi:ABC-type glycerol-3-phosphate transport system substrate-binding protein
MSQSSRTQYFSSLRLASFLTIFVLSLLLQPRLLGQSAITLRLTDWADLDEMPLDRQAIAAFECLYPNIHIVYEPNPGRQYEEKILTGLAANEPPDVFILPNVTSFVAIALVWMWIYHPTFGAANFVLNLFGFPSIQ